MEIAGFEPNRNWFDQGETALSAKDPEEAAKCFGMVLKEDPFSAKAHGGLSRAYWQQGKTEDALNSLTRALELEPDDRDTVLQCSRIFDALGKKDFSREVLQAYIGRNPRDQLVQREMDLLSGSVTSAPSSDTGEFFRKQGEMQFELGNLDHAVACFEMAIESDPGLAEAHNNLGVIRWKSGNLEKALEHFYKALDLKPEDPEILCNSARVLSQAGRADLSVSLFREYLRHSPDDNKVWDEYEALVRQTAAVQWKPEGLSPVVADIYVKAAKQLLDAGDFAGAAEVVDKALKIDQGASEALFVLGALHHAIGQIEEAAEILEHVLQLYPAHPGSAALLKSIRNGNGNGASGKKLSKKG
jgi:tetratricopeptide (TPR) repeat protein